MDFYQAEKELKASLQRMYNEGQLYAKEMLAAGYLEHQKEIVDKVFSMFPEFCRGFWDMCKALDMVNSVQLSFAVKES
jgi:hypothetical protein